MLTVMGARRNLSGGGGTTNNKKPTNFRRVCCECRVRERIFRVFRRKAAHDVIFYKFQGGESGPLIALPLPVAVVHVCRASLDVSKRGQTPRCFWSSKTTPIFVFLFDDNNPKNRPKTGSFSGLQLAIVFSPYMPLWRQRVWAFCLCRLIATISTIAGAEPAESRLVY